MPRVAVLSDLHLSHSHGFFWENWRRARDAANAARPDLVVVNGDLCINGPDDPEELAFAARELCGLHAPVLALPGNHDVGDEPPGQDPAQLVTPERLAAWERELGDDRWSAGCGAWRLIGLNAQLLGSGLEREAQQDEWLGDELAAAGDAPVAVFLHKPLFLDDAAETAPTVASLNPAPRQRLLRLLEGSGVRLVVSGHLHQGREMRHGALRLLWAPAVAFEGSHGHGGDPRLGGLLLDVTGTEVAVTPLPIPGLVPHDLDAIKGHGRYRFLRDMPAAPPPAE